MHKMRTVSPAIAELVSECNNLAERPFKIKGVDDLYMAAFYKMIGRVIIDNPDFQELLQFAMDTKRSAKPFSGSLAALALQRTCQAELMDQPGYPYAHPEQWRTALNEIIEDPSRLESMCYRIAIFDVSSDVPQRGAGPKFVALAYQSDKIYDPSDPFSVLNIGSSTGHTHIMMMLGEIENVPFSRIKINTSLLDQQRVGTLEDDMNKRLRERFVFGDCRSVDAFPLDDKEFLKHAKACSLYPGEFLDQEKVGLWEKLEKIRHVDQRFKYTAAIFGRDDDLYKPDDSYKDGLGPSDYYSAVGGMTFMYLNNTCRQKDIFAQGMAHLNPSGLFTLQEFMEVSGLINPADPIAQLNIFGPTTTPYKYTTVQYDPNDPDKGMQVDALWETARCETMMPTQQLVNALKA
jgi:hypothetical protein